MTNVSLAHLRNPITGEPLERYFSPLEWTWRRDLLIGTRSKEWVRVHNGIPDLIPLGGVLPHNRTSQRFYNRVAPLYDALSDLLDLWRSLRNRTDPRASFLAALGVQAGDDVLEIGCGTGYNLAALPKSANLYGLDFSKAMLELARTTALEGSHAQLVQGEAERLPFANSSFDVAFLYGGLNPNTEWARVLSEMRRVTRPGGVVAIAAARTQARG